MKQHHVVLLVSLALLAAGFSSAVLADGPKRKGVWAEAPIRSARGASIGGESSAVPVTGGSLYGRNGISKKLTVSQSNPNTALHNWRR